jgi:hydroxyacylglutathione hydrolase
MKHSRRCAVLFVSCWAAAAGCALADDGPSPWASLGGALPGSNGSPVLTGSGPFLVYSPVTLTLNQARPNATSWLFVGLTRVDLPLLGGTLIPAPDVVISPLVTDANGAWTLTAPLPPGVPVGASLYFQCWIQEPANPLGAAASNGLSAVMPAGPEGGAFPVKWINGLPNCASEPSIQIHAYNPDLYILRQSLCTNFEAPFITLIFGDTKVLMLDTGAGGIQIYNTVKSIIDSWLLAKGKPSIQLIVAHTHAHGDHVAGDSQFSGKPNTTLVGTSTTSVQNFFGISSWPTQVVPYDLGGGRIVDVIPIPGHQSAHIAVYDRRTAILFTGDSLYPGRLYVNGASSQGNWGVFKASVARLVNFTTGKDLCWVIGTHIEMTTTPTVDIPIGSLTHPNEHVLQLDRSHLLLLNSTLATMPTPAIKKLNDFIIYPIN